jgi:hypothetical protein
VNVDITYNQESDYIHAVTTGLFDEEALTALGQRFAKESEHHHCHKILNDMRGAQLSLETYVIYETPKKAVIAGFQDCRRAIVFSGDKQDYKFFETVASNQGQVVRVFTDIDQALHWLLI